MGDITFYLKISKLLVDR